jgi:hypothetical protein
MMSRDAEIIEQYRENQLNKYLAAQDEYCENFDKVLDSYEFTKLKSAIAELENLCCQYDIEVKDVIKEAL